MWLATRQKQIWYFNRRFSGSLRYVFGCGFSVVGQSDVWPWEAMAPICAPRPRCSRFRLFCWKKRKKKFAESMSDRVAGNTRTIPKAQTTQDAGRDNWNVFPLMLLACSVDTPFTSTGRLALRVATRVLCWLGLMLSKHCRTTLKSLRPSMLQISEREWDM